MAVTQSRTLRWNVDDYHKLAEQGWFEGKRVELIAGEIIAMSPIGSRHWTAVNKISSLFHHLLGHQFIVSTQNSLRLSQYSEPEPDIALIEGKFDDYRDALPRTAVLIIEVSDTTLADDRREKASLYAYAAIADYWLLNLNDNQLEVHRQPVAMADQPFGYGYQEVTIYKREEAVTALAAPAVPIAVADLLP